jgi:hypothetical protein
MSVLKDAIPDIDPKRKTPKKHFGNLRMPPVPHPPGALIERFQPVYSPLNRRMAMVLLGIAGFLLAGGVITYALRGKAKAHQHPNQPCVEGTKPSGQQPTPKSDQHPPS